MNILIIGADRSGKTSLVKAMNKTKSDNQFVELHTSENGNFNLEYHFPNPSAASLIAAAVNCTEAVKETQRMLEILSTPPSHYYSGKKIPLPPKEFGLQKLGINKFPKYKKSNNFTKK